MKLNPFKISLWVILRFDEILEIKVLRTYVFIECVSRYNIVKHVFFLTSLLEYNCFTMLC